MAFNANGDSKFGRAMSSGLLATIAWGIILVTYCVFRAFGIEDPILGQVFLLLTGLWVGNLTLAQGKKQAKLEDAAAAAKQATEDNAVQIQRHAADIDKLHEQAEASETRADASEDRETGWSSHKDHTEGEQP